MTVETTIFDFQAAIRRLETARVALERIKDGQALPDDNILRLLCNAGFLEHVKMSDGKLSYSITWKGLCFIDTVNLYEETRKNQTLAPNKDIVLQVGLVAFSFH